MIKFIWEFHLTDENKLEYMKKLITGVLLSMFCAFTMIAQNGNKSWKAELQEQLQLLGHRNWILVVDEAYPLQSKAAIKTIHTGQEQLTVVADVMQAIDQASHVYPVVFLDKEIDFVPEKEAAGINDYRKNLFKMLKGKDVNKKLHEALIADIDEAAKVFNILVLKTNLTIPYTSVFFRLDCGYWNGEQEKEMRKLMND
jgi:L-fucose mutarotase/ribose pyranase (RbsD/FucU family)